MTHLLTNFRAYSHDPLQDLMEIVKESDGIDTFNHQQCKFRADDRVKAAWEQA